MVPTLQYNLSPMWQRDPPGQWGSFRLLHTTATFTSTFTWTLGGLAARVTATVPIPPVPPVSGSNPFGTWSDLDGEDVGWYSDDAGAEAFMAWAKERHEQCLAFLLAIPALTRLQQVWLPLLQQRVAFVTLAAQPCYACGTPTCAGLAQATDPRSPEMLLTLAACPVHLRSAETIFEAEYTTHYCQLTPDETARLLPLPTWFRHLRATLARLGGQVTQYLLAGVATLLHHLASAACRTRYRLPPGGGPYGWMATCVDSRRLCTMKFRSPVKGPAP